MEIIGSDTDACELARLVVMVLSVVDGQPLKLADLEVWLGESRARTEGAIKAASNHGWIARSNKGITMLGAGQKILNGGHRERGPNPVATARLAVVNWEAIRSSAIISRSTVTSCCRAQSLQARTTPLGPNAPDSAIRQFKATAP